MAGVKMTPSVTKATVRNETRVNVALTNVCVSFLPSSVSDFSRYLLNVGMNATEIEFSANNRLNKLGIIKAMPKASEIDDVPRNFAFVISRINPMIRESNVNMEREMPFATMECC